MSERKLDDAIGDFLSHRASAAAREREESQSLQRAQEEAKQKRAEVAKTYAAAVGAFRAAFTRVAKAFQAQGLKADVVEETPSGGQGRFYALVDASKRNLPNGGDNLVSLVACVKQRVNQYGSTSPVFAAVRAIRPHGSDDLVVLGIATDDLLQAVSITFVFDAKSIQRDPSSVESHVARAIDELRAQEMG